MRATSDAKTVGRQRWSRETSGRDILARGRVLARLLPGIVLRFRRLRQFTASSRDFAQAMIARTIALLSRETIISEARATLAANSLAQLL